MSTQPIDMPPQGGQSDNIRIADVYRHKIDAVNSEREQRQWSEISMVSLELDNKPFNLVTYRPTDGERTWQNSDGEWVTYPELLMVHGVASDARYFDQLFQKMNKLGIRCSAVELTREEQIVPNINRLTDWQVGATILARDYLEDASGGRSVILGGHSRGAIIAIEAERQIAQSPYHRASEGLLPLAPAGLGTYSLSKSAGNLTRLAFNSLRDSGDSRLVGRFAVMITKVIADNPVQTVLESIQALRTNLSDVLCHELSDTSVFIPTAEHDEFSDYKKIARLAMLAPNGNIVVTSLATNHMLEQKQNPDVLSLSDPRTLPGQILAWMQSLTDGYAPLAINGHDGRIGRLANSDN